MYKLYLTCRGGGYSGGETGAGTQLVADLGPVEAGAADR